MFSILLITRAGLPATDPASVGLDPGRLKRIDGAIDRAIERGQVRDAARRHARHQYVDRLVGAEQHGAELQRVVRRLHQVEGDVRRIDIRHDQQVRRALQRRIEDGAIPGPSR